MTIIRISKWWSSCLHRFVKWWNDLRYVLSMWKWCYNTPDLNQ